MKKVFFLSVLVTLFICAWSLDSFPQNIALNKPYTFSLAPNYRLCSADPSHTLLTDGTYTSGHFWTSQTTTGWHTKKISIEIDLQTASPIDKVTFNTARGSTSGVQYPSYILVFTSTDKKNYTYDGDAAIDPDNNSGAYQVKKFALSGINKTARYVQLVVIPNGTFVFCDEIEVMGGTSTRGRASGSEVATTPITNVSRAADSLIGNKSSVKKMAFRVQHIEASLNQPDSANVAASLSAAPAKDVATRLSRATGSRRLSLKAKFKNDIVVDQVNPWLVIRSPYKPVGGTDNTYNIVTTINRAQYGAYVITNLSNTDQAFNCQFDKGSGISDNDLYSVPFITSGFNYVEIADPLVPISGPVTLKSGESQMFMFRVTGQRAGKISSKIKINAGTFSYEYTANINVIDLGPTKPGYLVNSVCWAYFTYPLISDRTDAATTDLLEHHTTTMVVPPTKVPMLGASDFSAFSAYVGKLKPFSNIFLFANWSSKAYKDEFAKDVFMSDGWKTKFEAWYSKITQTAQAAGISPQKLYLYMFDEIKDQDVDQCTTFLNWLKSKHPEIHTFGTLITNKSVNALVPLLTISQPHDTNDLLKQASSYQGRTQWIYNTKERAESLSPYSYYRLMAWKAFANGYTGIGFWNYADYQNGNTNKADVDSFDGANANNYSVIYDGPGQTIISSKRWEAYRLGIEDYELLKRYAEKNGMDQAKQLAQSVLNASRDEGKADAVRKQLFEGLSR